MQLQLLLAKDAWSQIDAAAAAGNQGAVRPESFFIGQVVGAFAGPRLAAEIARTMDSDCKAEVRRLAGLCAGGALPPPPHSDNL